MVSLTLTPFAPWHAAHTVAALALPASISAACANGATARATDNPSTFFMGLLLCTRTQGYTSNPARTMPPSATPRRGQPLFPFSIPLATLNARLRRDGGAPPDTAALCPPSRPPPPARRVAHTKPRVGARGRHQ